MPLSIIAICLILYIAVRWAFFPQAVVIEGSTPGEALSLRADLVEGSWWRAFGILITVWVIGSAVSSPTSIIGWTISRSAGQLLTVLVSVVVRPFMASAWTLLFFDLSSRKTQRLSSAKDHPP
jgi:hypothetical protein